MKKRRWNRNNIIFYSLGILLALSMVVGLVVSFVNPGSTSNDPQTISDADFQLTRAVTPRPTAPAPVSEVVPGRRVVNRTGAFEIPVPVGDWDVLTTCFASSANGDCNLYDLNRNRADIMLNSGQRLSIVQASAVFGVNYETTQSLSENYLTDGFLLSDWSTNYERREVLERTVDDTFVTINFDLQDEGIDYFGRQISWQDDGNLYSLRFVVPTNNPELLANLQALYLEKFTPYPDLVRTPLALWTTHSDPTWRVMVKTPENWQQLSGSTGRRTTYDLPNTPFQAIVDHHVGVTLDDLDMAEAWVMEQYPNAQIIEAQVVTQPFADGYRVSFTYRNADGDPISAALALLNNPHPEAGLSTVLVRVDGVEVNLLDLESTSSEVVTTRDILLSFTVMAPDDYVYELPTAVSVPPDDAPPVAEATAEDTSASQTTPETNLEATPEASATIGE